MTTTTTTTTTTKKWSNVVGVSGVDDDRNVVDLNNLDNWRFKAGPLSIPVMCRFMQERGNCEAGENCPFRHSFDGLKEEARRGRWEREMNSATFEAGVRGGIRAGVTGVTDEGACCGICFDNVANQKKRFGILKCSHPFCLDCIRSWRGEKDSVLTKACPVCRVQSNFIIPSATFVTGLAEKRELLKQYLESTSRIKCRYFDGLDTNSCPFKTSCHYLHVDKRTGKKIERGEGMQARFILNEGGEATGVIAPLLCNFIDENMI